jgi:hypothetical protein
MKTQVRYVLLIITLGIFGSCAEPFREMGTRRSDFSVNHSTPEGHAYAFNPSSNTKSGSGFQKIPRDTVHVAEESSLRAIRHMGAAQSNLTLTDKKGEMSLMSEQTIGVAIPEKTVVVPKKGVARLAPFVLKQLHSGPSSLNRSTRLTQKSDTVIGKSNSSNKEPINGYLIALGILGLIFSLMGMFTAVIGILLGNSSFLMEILGFIFYPLIIDFLLFLLGLIGSIGLLVSPRIGDGNILKTIMIILASLPMILWLLIILFY